MNEFSKELTIDIVRGMSPTGGIEPGGAFFFAWTLIALGVTVFSVILSTRGLWSLQRGQPTPRGARS
jgi:hypothetical protein